MAGYKKAGTDLDTLLEPRQSGDGYAAATGYKINGADLNTKYAPESVGSAYTGGTGYKDNGSDIGPRFCAKGTRVTALGFDGGSYSSNTVRSQASITLRFNASGTWEVIKNSNTSTSGGTVLASGNWLIQGGSASDYTVVFSTTGLQSGDVYAGDPSTPGAPYLDNTATTQQALTSVQYVHAGAAAIVSTNVSVAQSGTMTAKLYKNGTLISTSTCSVYVQSNGA